MANLRDANIFQDFTVWVDNVGKIGAAPSFQPPEINVQMEEFRGGGMDGTVEISMGIEKIEFDFDLHTWDPQVFENLGFGLGVDVNITFRGYLITPSGSEKPVYIETHSIIKGLKPNKIEAGKKAEITVNCVAHYYKHVIDSKTVTEIDVYNKITIIGGRDRSRRAREILGFTS